MKLVHLFTQQIFTEQLVRLPSSTASGPGDIAVRMADWNLALMGLTFPCATLDDKQMCILMMSLRIKMNEAESGHREGGSPSQLQDSGKASLRR